MILMLLFYKYRRVKEAVYMVGCVVMVQMNFSSGEASGRRFLQFLPDCRYGLRGIIGGINILSIGNLTADTRPLDEKNTMNICFRDRNHP